MNITLNFNSLITKTQKTAIENNAKLFLNEIGYIFRIYAGTSLTGCTVVIDTYSPSGVNKAWVASIDTNSKYAKYTILNGDLNESGDWMLSLHVTDSNGNTFIGETAKFTVYEQFLD